MTNRNGAMVQRCSPALQTSGRYTFWLCLVGNLVTLKSVERTHTRAVGEKQNLSLLKVRKFSYCTIVLQKKKKSLSLRVDVCDALPVNAARQPLA